MYEIFNTIVFKSAVVRRLLKISLRITGLLLAALLLLWLGLALYVITHKQYILSQFALRAGKYLSGRLHVADVEPNFFSEFPLISVTFDDVSVADTSRKVGDSLFAKKLFLSANAWSFFSRNVQFREIKAKDGFLLVCTDSGAQAGFFRRRKPADTAAQKLTISELSLDNMLVIVASHSMAPRAIVVKQAATHLHFSDTCLTTRTDLHIIAPGDRELKGEVWCVWHPARSQLTVSCKKLTLNDMGGSLDGSVTFNGKPHFEASLQAPAVRVATLLPLLPPQAAAVIGLFNISKPISASAAVSGNVAANDTPDVRVNFTVRSADLRYKSETIKHCSFDGVYANRYSRRVHHETNHVRIYGFSGDWQGIGFRADTILVYGETRPAISFRLVSDFSLTQLNGIIGQRFRFSNGSAHMNLAYRGTMFAGDSSGAFKGGVTVRGADFTFLPHDITITNGSFDLVFAGRDLNLQHAVVQNGPNRILASGVMNNFSSLYFTNPGKITFRGNVYSPYIDLNEYAAKIKKRTAAPSEPAAKDSVIRRISRQMNEWVDFGNAQLSVRIDTMVFGKFVAEKVSGDMTADQNDVVVSNCSVSNAGGVLNFNGALHAGAGANKVSVDASIRQVDVREFFRSFDNFGMHNLTYKNVSGKLDGTAALSATLTDAAKLTPGSVGGTVYFSILDGELIDYDPLHKIGRLVFRNRDLSDIHFSRLEDTLTIRGNKVQIAPMSINSTAIDFNVAGVYAFDRGTDINIDVPMRNLSKSDLNDSGLSQVKRLFRKMTLHLKAVDDQNGALKIKWAPFGNRL